MDNIKDVAELYLGEVVNHLPTTALKEIADKLDEAGESYHSFWSFRKNAKGFRSLYKNELLSPKTWDWFMDTREKAKIQARIKAGLELETFYAEVNLHDDPEKVLNMAQVSIGPLLRYLMAMYLGYPDIAEVYREGAILSLKEEPLNFELYGKLSEYFPITKTEVIR